jgi:predicted TIM-barrel enzyme
MCCEDAVYVIEGTERIDGFFGDSSIERFADGSI